MHILVVRSGALGDTILTFPLLTSIGRIYRDATLTLLADRSYLDLVPPGVQCRPIDSSSSTWLFEDSDGEFLADGFAFDLVFVILNRPDQVVDNLLRSGAKVVRHVSASPIPGMHLVEHLHSGLGMLPSERRPSLYHLASQEKKNLIWMHPGSGGPSKCIPLNLLVSLAEKLRKDTEWDLVVTATEQDAFLMHLPEWQDLVGRPGTRLIRNKPLKMICEEMSGAQLFLGNDSGMSHLAAGLGIRSAVFFLSSDPAIWAPWVPENQVSIIDCRTGIPDLSELERHAYKLLEPGRKGVG